MTKTLRIEKNANVSRRWITANPGVSAPVEFFPDGCNRHFSGQRLNIRWNNRGIATAWVGRDRNDQTTRLIMLPQPSQFALCCVDDAVKFAGNDADDRLVAGLCVAYAQKIEQRLDVVVVTMRMLATKTADGIELGGFKVSRASVKAIGMLVRPWTGYVVLA